MSIPILSRLEWDDYKRISLAISILLLEGLLRFSTWIIPLSILDFLRYRVLRAIPRIFRGFHDEDISESQDPFQILRTTPELARYHGFECEDHLAITSDGYYLVMHRISSKTSPNERNGVPPTPEPSTNSNFVRPVVLMIHGAMMNSEVWVCQRQSNKNLALLLVSEGYDVWLGNRRGNKYSQKHAILRPTEKKFWDHSIDETALNDIPAQVDYILQATGARSLGMVGFSQGTAEILAAVSVKNSLANRVNCVVALSATAKPPKTTNTLIRSMIRWPPELVFLIFGRLSLLNSVCFWERILSPKAMVWLMDVSMLILFGWRNNNIRAKDKPHIYSHLYSEASVKQIVHWFQIMRAGRFQMYDDLGAGAFSVVPEYPLKSIKVPLLIAIGTNDCLADEPYLRGTFKFACIHKIHTYEHMDTIWASSADKKVFPLAVDFIRAHSEKA